MMKRLLTLLLITAAVAANGQVTGFVPYKSKVNYIGIASDSLAYMPVKDTTHTPTRLGAYTMRPQDSCVYIGISTTLGTKRWLKLGSMNDIPTNYADSLRRSGLNVQMRKNGVWTTQYTDSTGSGITQEQLDDSTAAIRADFPTGGGADSSVFATLYRLDSAKNNLRTDIAAKVSGSGATDRVAIWNGTNSITSTANFRAIDNIYYPTFYVGQSSIFGGSLALKVGTTSDYAQVMGESGLTFLVPANNKNFSFNTPTRQLFRLYEGNTGGSATFNKTTISVDTAVGGPTIGSIQVIYRAGDSTSIGTDVGRHEFRGIGATYANGGSFNTFYSTVEAGNTTYNQDHIINWQSDAKKTGANTLDKIYHLGILGDSINAGAVNHRWGVMMYDAVVRAGATLHEQTALRVPKLKGAKAGQNYAALIDSSDYVQLAGKFSFGSDSTRPADFNVKGTAYFDGNVGIGTSSPSSKLEVSGSLATKYTATATGITLDATHCVVNVTATGQTITLPAASAITGRQYTIKLTASGSCTIDGNASETIDGATTYSLASQYKYVTIVSDGSNWIITANN